MQPTFDDTAFASAALDASSIDGHERYAKNLAALWPVDATLARRLEALDFGTIAARLTSAHQPDEPAGGLEGIRPEEQFAFQIYGVGAHVPALFDRVGGVEGEAIFLIFEPSLEHLRDEFLRRDYSQLLTSRRAILFAMIDPIDIGQRLAPLTATIALGLTSLADRRGVARDAAFFEAAGRAMADFVTFTNTNIATAIQYGRKTTFNVIDNLSAYASAPDLSRLKGAFKGAPAILVSAGPSLQKNIDQLRVVAGRAVIIAVQTTLKPLLAAGVVPQFVTALDHHEISTRFYENLPDDLTTELVAEPKVSGQVIAAWQQDPRRKLTLLGNEAAESLLREVGLNKPTLPPGATVAHLAFSLAEHLGCGTAILVGQDLGFSDGLAYAPGTSYDDVWRAETGRFVSFEMKQWEHIARDRAALRRLPDWHGVPTYTEQRLFSYLQQFERMFACSAVRVIDATEGGVAKKGADPMTLAEAVAMFCRTEIGPCPPYPELGMTKRDVVARSLAKRKVEAVGIAEVCRETLPLLRSLVTHIDDQPRVNATIALLDDLRRRLVRHDETYRLILTLSQRSEQERYRADRRIRAVGAGGIERQRLQAERDLANVEAILESAMALAERLSPYATKANESIRRAA